MVYHRIWNILVVPCAIQWDFVVCIYVHIKHPSFRSLKSFGGTNLGVVSRWGGVPGTAPEASIIPIIQTRKLSTGRLRSCQGPYGGEQQSWRQTGADGLWSLSYCPHSGRILTCNLLGTVHWHQAERLWPPSLCPPFSLHPAHTVPMVNCLPYSPHFMHATSSSTVPSTCYVSLWGTMDAPFSKGLSICQNK